MHILDCTLRDGGYYNNWCFSRELTNAYLQAMHRAGIDYVEIGFRNFPQARFLGPYAYSLEHYLSGLTIPHELKLGAMVDAKSVLNSALPVQKAVNALFVPQANSHLCFVRVATHVEQAANCEPLVTALKALGYTVALNLMQIAGQASDKISTLAAEINRWGSVAILYFADSFGAMDNTEVERVSRALRDHWSGDLGIHTHNNQSLAIHNSLYAVEHGIRYVDATLLGMGRGAGNADLAILLSELSQRGKKDVDLSPIYTLGETYFTPLKQQYDWGPNFFYHYSAQHNIHPMFAQTLINDKRYSSREKLMALTALAESESSSFSSATINQKLSGFNNIQPLDEQAPALDFSAFQGKDIILMGAGDSVVTYADDITHFIQHHTALTLSINHQAALDLKVIDGIICIDQHRLLYEADFLAHCGKPIYSAQRLQDQTTREKLSAATIHEYDCLLKTGVFEANTNGCIIPVPLALAYALALCVAGQAKRLFLLGFDGFPADDSRQQEMLNLWHDVEPACKKLPIIALTPSNYPVTQGSLYADYN